MEQKINESFVSSATAVGPGDFRHQDRAPVASENCWPQPQE